jgi:hypothetical protein
MRFVFFLFLSEQTANMLHRRRSSGGGELFQLSHTHA